MTTTTSQYVVKVREKGKRAWAFVTSNGKTNHLRIHAAQWINYQNAASVRDQLETDNPEYEFKVVPF